MPTKKPTNKRKRGRPLGSKNRTKHQKPKNTNKKIPNKHSRKSIQQYTHDAEKRPNNPPVGLVTLGTDPDQPSKKYQYDPRLDPVLMWSGKQENSEFEVDTVSLHVHERIDPITILEKAMKPNIQTQKTLANYFEQPENNPPLRNAIEFYKHDQNWSNRLITGDSLLVMNSLLEKEEMRRKVQMIYIDPPYGIKYGSNFQPFVNNKNIQDGKAEDLTQEPETIKAFRDTWELGIHSYLSYLRNRLLLAKELLTESGSCFVQISDENVYLIRHLMNEIFGSDNFISEIVFVKTSGFTTTHIASTNDYLIWYANDKKKMKYRQLFLPKEIDRGINYYNWIELLDKTRRKLTKSERDDPRLIPPGKIFRISDIQSQGESRTNQKFVFEGKTYLPRKGSHWKTTIKGLENLAKKNRIMINAGLPVFIRYLEDYPVKKLTNVWDDTATGGFTDKKIYSVQTGTKIISRCILMTTDPCDLVLDITCGSGTTAYAAETWGRRWITCDTSRIAITLTKQRLMTSFYNSFELKHELEGVAGGFAYNTVSHITMGSIAHDEPSHQEILYNQPVINTNKTRISGPFTVESVPSPTVKSIDDLFEESKTGLINASSSKHEDWRQELEHTGIRGKNGQKIEFVYVESHPATKWLHAVAKTRGEENKRVMVSFGPEYAPLEQRQVERALNEAQHLIPRPDIVIFAAMQFDPEAAKDIDETKWSGVTILKVEMNKDLLTMDLKKNRTTNESFWLMGQPDVKLKKIDSKKYVAIIDGFDYYNTKTGEIDSGNSSKIAMWLLDTDYDDRSVYPQQVFFPMEKETDGWSKLARTLHEHIDEDLIAKYRGVESIPFEMGDNKKIAVKIIDDRGIESLKTVEL